jgi:dihydroorotate dehydrogenase (NAD+) catalytic subunit
MSKLSVEVGGLRLSNPTILASGVLSNGPLLKQAALAGAGAVVTKSLTVKRRDGSATPVVVGTRAGFLNNVGLANPGYAEFLEHDLPIAKEGGVPVIVSTAGFSWQEFVEICVRAEEAGADAVELNLSCPNVEGGGIEFGRDPEISAKVVGEVRKKVDIPLFAKLGLTDRIAEVGRAVQKAGADGVVAINTITGMAIDIEARRPVLAGIYGGLSGPAIHPVAVRCIHQLHERLEIPVIGCGGVESWRDVVEFILAGASAVQVGSAVAIGGLSVFREICKGIEDYMKRKRFKSIRGMVGKLKL